RSRTPPRSSSGTASGSTTSASSPTTPTRTARGPTHRRSCATRSARSRSTTSASSRGRTRRGSSATPCPKQFGRIPMPTELPPRVRIGAAVARLEDDALLRGRGRYVDDIRIGQLHAVFVRSPFAHARIVQVHTEAAAKEPGIAAVLTADDLRLAPIPPHPMMPARVFDRPPLATGVVRYVGDPVAVVVGERRPAAVDAAEAV